MAGVSQPSPLTPARQRAQALADSGDRAGAVALLEHAVGLGRTNLGEDDPDVVAAAHQLARIHQEMDDPSAARRVLEEAYAGGHWRLGDSDPLMLEISYDLGVVAEELGNRHEARKALGRVVEAGQPVLGDFHWAVVKAKAYLDGDTDALRPPSMAGGERSAEHGVRAVAAASPGRPRSDPQASAPPARGAGRPDRGGRPAPRARQAVQQVPVHGHQQQARSQSPEQMPSSARPADAGPASPPSTASPARPHQPFSNRRLRSAGPATPPAAPVTRAAQQLPVQPPAEPSAAAVQQPPPAVRRRSRNRPSGNRSPRVQQPPIPQPLQQPQSPDGEPARPIPEPHCSRPSLQRRRRCRRHGRCTSKHQRLPASSAVNAGERRNPGATSRRSSNPGSLLPEHRASAPPASIHRIGLVSEAPRTVARTLV